MYILDVVLIPLNFTYVLCGRRYLTVDCNFILFSYRKHDLVILSDRDWSDWTRDLCDRGNSPLVTADRGCLSGPWLLPFPNGQHGRLTALATVWSDDIFCVRKRNNAMNHLFVSVSSWLQLLRSSTCKKTIQANNIVALSKLINCPFSFFYDIFLCCRRHLRY